MKEVKVRINKTTDSRFNAWLDANGVSYYYGRPYIDIKNVTPEIERTEHDIEDYLHSRNVEFEKTRLNGCLPEWLINFTEKSDLNYFLLRWGEK